MREIVFAIPGELNTHSGGYGYDRRLMLELRLQGRSVTHLELGASYPNPTATDAAHAALALADLTSDCILIVDGLALGAMDTAVIASLEAELVALIHHPLALEGDMDPGRKEQLFSIERENLKHAKRVIVPSPHTAQLLVLDYGVPAEQITVARPGIDQSDRPKGQMDPPLILSVGIQVPRKGHDVLLRSLANIKHIPWQAVIVGPPLDAGYAASLVDLTQELGLSDRVELAGLVNDSELAALYRSASIFALATRFEGYGIVFGEAMVHGLPIVSCKVGAVGETVSAKASMLVEPNDPDAFGSALANLLQNPELHAELAAAAIEAGANLISWKDSARLVGEMLDAISVGNN
jgi:glycosyltransferase involved in cell wall biosynthesis